MARNPRHNSIVAMLDALAPMAAMSGVKPDQLAGSSTLPTMPLLPNKPSDEDRGTKQSGPLLSSTVSKLLRSPLIQAGAYVFGGPQALAQVASLVALDEEDAKTKEQEAKTEHVKSLAGRTMGLNRTLKGVDKDRLLESGILQSALSRGDKASAANIASLVQPRNLVNEKNMARSGLLALDPDAAVAARTEALKSAAYPPAPVPYTLQEGAKRMLNDKVIGDNPRIREQNTKAALNSRTGEVVFATEAQIQENPNLRPVPSKNFEIVSDGKGGFTMRYGDGTGGELGEALETPANRDKMRQDRDYINSVLEDLSSVITKAEDDPSLVGALGSIRRGLQTTMGVAGDVAGAVPGVSFLIDSARDTATSIIGGEDSEFSAMLEKDFFDENLSDLSLLENSIALALAKTRTSGTGRMLADVYLKSRDDVKLSGFKSSRDTVQKLKTLESMLQRELSLMQKRLGLGDAENLTDEQILEELKRRGYRQ